MKEARRVERKQKKEGWVKNGKKEGRKGNTLMDVLIDSSVG